MEKDDLLNLIYSYSFAQNEWNLYLDTHPYDKFALKTHQEVSKKTQELTKEYEEKYGAFTAQNNLSQDRWNWTDDPWPWD